MPSPRTLALLFMFAAPTLPACEPPPPKVVPAAPLPPKPQPAPTPAAPDPAAQAHYVKALELESAGRLPEAELEVGQALAAGAGRDARVLAAKLAILRNDLDAAAAHLAPHASDAADSLVQYNLGVIAQQRNQYNAARSAYLAALKADPTYAPARFNLAYLTMDAGVHEEAKHHARKFLELTPGDPRAPELRQKVQLDAPPPDPNTGLRDPSADTAKKPGNDLKAPRTEPQTGGDLKDPFNARQPSPPGN